MPTVAIYIKSANNSNGSYNLNLYLDPGSPRKLLKNVAVPVGSGDRLEFRPYPPQTTIPDLIVIAQTVSDPNVMGGVIMKGSPFVHNVVPADPAYPAISIPGGASGGLSIINLPDVPPGRPAVAYKFSLMALFDNGQKPVTIDPIVIVRPN